MTRKSKEPDPAKVKAIREKRRKPPNKRECCEQIVGELSGMAGELARIGDMLEDLAEILDERLPKPEATVSVAFDPPEDR